MKNSKYKKLSYKLSINLFFKMVGWIIGYTILGFMGLYSAIRIFGLRTWTGDELIYKIANWVDTRKDLVMIGYILIGSLVIFFYFWKKPFEYLQEVADATEIAYKQDERFVELSAPIQDVEFKMNQIKLSLMNHERAAKEAEQRKNDLVAYLAHDLKTPITSVIGYITLLKDEKQISEEIRQKYLSITLQKAEHLDDLINEFFEITRFNLTNISLEYQQVNLTRLLNQLIFEFKPMLNEKNLECKLTAPDGITLRCDPDKIQRVLDNLLRNAVNYSFENTTIYITAMISGGDVSIQFLNQGNTISKDKLERIFEQFYRLDNSRSTNSGGAGLGLAIAKEIIELHGGNITAESENDEIIFVANLPLL